MPSSRWSLLVLAFSNPRALRPVGNTGTKKTALLEGGSSREHVNTLDGHKSMGHDVMHL